MTFANSLSHMGALLSLRRLPEEGVLVIVGKSHQHFGYNVPSYGVERS
jgi:hypothetical protein